MTQTAPLALVPEINSGPPPPPEAPNAQEKPLIVATQPSNPGPPPSPTRPASQPITAVPPHTAPVITSNDELHPLSFRSRTFHITDQSRSRMVGPSASQQLQSVAVDNRPRLRRRRSPLPNRMQHFFDRLEVTKRSPGTRVDDYRETSAYRRSNTLSKEEWCERRRKWDPFYAEQADSIISESEFGDGSWWRRNGQQSDGSKTDEEEKVA